MGRIWSTGGRDPGCRAGDVDDPADTRLDDGGGGFLGAWHWHVAEVHLDGVDFLLVSVQLIQVCLDLGVE
jgi:hypothetical protein